MGNRIEDARSKAMEAIEQLPYQGIVETHFHIGPELIHRRYDVSGLAAAARATNATLVLKNHTYPTTPLAAHARAHEGVTFLGGLVLNSYVGGLNHHAVDATASGNRTIVDKDGSEPPFVVWMPTVDARAHRESLGHRFDPRWSGCSGCSPATEDIDGASIVDVFRDDGDPTSELIEVLQKVAAHGAVLATGHLSAADVMQLIPIAIEMGISKVIVTHPHFPCVNLTEVQLVELVANECVFIEHCAAINSIENVPLTRFVNSIKATGVEQTILSTDHGQVHSPEFPAGTIEYAKAIFDLYPDLNTVDLVGMFTSVPRRALGLPDTPTGVGGES